MTEDPEMAALLAAEKDVFAKSAPRGAHVPDEVIARCIEQHEPLPQEYLAHVADCAECRAVAIDLVRVEEAAPPNVASLEMHRKNRIALGSAAAVAASIAIAMAVTSGDPQSGGLRGSEELGAEIALAIADAPIKDGETIAIGAPAAIRYTNTEGARATLVAVGWDGENVHRYTETPLKMRAGPNARDVAVVIDLSAANGHRAGPLEIAVGLDRNASQVEDWLRADPRPPLPKRVWLIEVSLE